MRKALIVMLLLTSFVTATSSSASTTEVRTGPFDIGQRCTSGGVRATIHALPGLPNLPTAAGICAADDDVKAGRLSVAYAGTHVGDSRIATVTAGAGSFLNSVIEFVESETTQPIKIDVNLTGGTAAGTNLICLVFSSRPSTSVCEPVQQGDQTLTLSSTISGGDKNALGVYLGWDAIELCEYPCNGEVFAYAAKTTIRDIRITLGS